VEYLSDSLPIRTCKAATCLNITNEKIIGKVPHLLPLKAHFQGRLFMQCERSVKVFYACCALSSAHLSCGAWICFYRNVSKAEGGLKLFSVGFQNKQFPGYHYFSLTSGILSTPKTPHPSVSISALSCNHVSSSCAYCYKPKNLPLCAVLTYPNWSSQYDSRVTGSVSRCQHSDCNRATAEELMQAQHTRKHLQR